MFKRFFGFLAATFILAGTMAGAAMASEDVTLTTSNTIALRSEVNGESVSAFIDQFYKSTANPVYVYIDSPGGSVIDGFKIIEAIKGEKNRQVICVANVAASMAFSILQACPVRYVTEHGIIMQHVGSYGVRGQSPNNVSMVNFLERVFKKLSADDAKRLGLSLTSFLKKTRDDWWMFSEEAVDHRAADDIANLTCTKELTDKRVAQTFFTFFGQVTVTYSGCPIASDPLSVDLKGNGSLSLRVIEEEYYQFVQKLYPRKYLLSRPAPRN